MTTLVHGERATEQVVAASGALFGRGELRELDAVDAVDAALAEVPTATFELAERPTVVDLLVATGLAESRGAARRTVAEGGAYVNNAKVTRRGVAPAAEDLLPADGSSCAAASATWPACAYPARLTCGNAETDPRFVPPFRAV